MDFSFLNVFNSKTMTECKEIKHKSRCKTRKTCSWDAACKQCHNNVRCQSKATKIVGKTKNGDNIFEGSKGGHFYMKGGKKIYVKGGKKIYVKSKGKKVKKQKKQKKPKKHSQKISQLSELQEMGLSSPKKVPFSECCDSLTDAIRRQIKIGEKFTTPKGGEYVRVNKVSKADRKKGIKQRGTKTTYGTISMYFENKKSIKKASAKKAPRRTVITSRARASMGGVGTLGKAKRVQIYRPIRFSTKSTFKKRKPKGVLFALEPKQKTYSSLVEAAKKNPNGPARVVVRGKTKRNGTFVKLNAKNKRWKKKRPSGIFKTSYRTNSGIQKTIYWSREGSVNAKLYSL